MFNGVFSAAPYYNESLADVGGRRALGMSGSLTNYINTGSTARLGKAPLKNDKYEKRNSECLASKRKSSKNKFLKTAGVILAAAATAAIAIKSGGVKKLANFVTKGKAEEKFANFGEGFKKKISSWVADLKVKNIENKANKKIEKLKQKANKKVANADLKAHKKALSEQLKNAKKAAAQKIRDYKKSAK